MWMVVYVSTSRRNAEKLVKALEEHKIISRLRCIKDGHSCFEVLVPQSELASAQELIFDDELF